VAGDGNDPEELAAQFEPPVLELHVDLHLRNGHAEKAVEFAADALKKVHLLAVQSDLDLLLVEKFGSLEVIGVRMRVDHVFDVFFLDAVVGHLVEEIRQVAREPRIDERLDVAADVVAVAVVVEIIGPFINVNVVSVLHETLSPLYKFIAIVPFPACRAAANAGFISISPPGGGRQIPDPGRFFPDRARCARRK